jgi:large subunit ribosomal protein L4
MVRGGGKKPWRQKGTGRARAGSIRSPLWRGGGITFGPTGEENYSMRLNTKAKRQALRQALSLASDGGKIIVMEDVLVKNGKTAELAALLSKVGANRSILIVVDQKGEDLLRAARNLANVKVSGALYVTVYDVLNADHVVFNQAALAATTAWLAAAKKASPGKETK